MRNFIHALSAGAMCLGLALAGCYPIELDVSQSGKILIPRQEGIFEFDAAAQTASLAYAPHSGKPQFALYSPDESALLCVTQSGGGMMGSSQAYAMVTLADKKARQIFSGSNGVYCRWSPDGKYVSIAQVASEAKAPMTENMPALHLVTVADGATKVIAENIGAHHRWMPDGKQVLLFQAMLKQEEGGYSGKLLLLDIENGQSTPLVTVQGDEMYFDVSPDGKHILLTADAAAKDDEALAPEEQMALYELTLADGALSELRKVRSNVAFAIYSPKGGKVLLGALQDDELSLLAADAKIAETVTVAKDAAKQIGGMGSNTSIYPSWIGEDRVAYLAQRAVYGTEGKNLMLVVASTDGKTKANLQAVVDAAAVKAADKPE